MPDMPEWMQIRFKSIDFSESTQGVTKVRYYPACA